ncbi:hypothetical protein AALO_G00090910 [Alosa alosa]|uniref:Uncharacterized protein n=1 Tax=Alosa alosa TaxID=278164 RepID=A0AAV6GRJ9_9TELE|nr:hypothetical protein AALO_G00090910 [Alosa alosa]
MQNQSSEPDSQSLVTAEETSDILIEKEDEEEEDAKNQEASEADMRDVAESKPLVSDPDDLLSAVPAQPRTPVLAIKEVVGPGPGRQTTTKTLMEKPWRDIHWGVVPADRVTLMEENDFKKMKQIRQQASEMGIPQLIILTKVDLACPEVQKNIKKIYRSKKIKEKMQECSNRLGGHMTDIFPVRNYHEEIDMNPDVNMLLLSALKPILNHANDYVEDNKPGWSVFSFLSWIFGQ